MLMPLMALLLVSCIKDEPAGSECDILDAWVEGEELAPHFFNTADMRVSNIPSDVLKIDFTVCDLAQLPPLALQLTVTPGATVVPASGSVQDFSKGPVIYTVTSEDGKWQRQYTVSFHNPPAPPVHEGKLTYDFEHFKLVDGHQRYYVWYELASDGTPNEKVWATGNAGFIIAKPNAASDAYPSVPETEGYEGSCVRLTTLDTGTWGRRFGKPIAAGNLFFGEFDSQYAVTKTLWTTKMGIPFQYEPLRVTGYYKYRAGDTFTDKEGNIIDRRDQPNIYAVLYRNQNSEGESVVLHGDDVMTSPLIVSKAQVESLPETDAWQPFEMAFERQADIDANLLRNRGYSLALVFSSSITGDTFEGAVGSTLYIDKVEITFITDEQ